MKVIIIGGLSKRRNLPRELDLSTEIWCMNAIRPKWLPKVSRTFNLHTYDNLSRYRWHRFDEEVQFSADHPDVPFYTIDEWPQPHILAGWREFPGRQMMQDMTRGDYHVGSADWLVAFAIWLRDHADRPAVTEIDIHGVQLTLTSGQPISARACLEYWCGRAEGAGIRVTLAKDANLFDFYHLVRSNLIYGYDDTPVVEDQTAAEITDRLAQRAVPPYDYDE